MADFAEALTAMKAGKRARRAIWRDSPGRFDGAYAEIHVLAAPYEPMIMVGYPGSTVFRPFAGAQWDLMSDDWEIL